MSSLMEVRPTKHQSAVTDIEGEGEGVEEEVEGTQERAQERAEQAVIAVDNDSDSSDDDVVILNPYVHPSSASDKKRKRGMADLKRSNSMSTITTSSTSSSSDGNSGKSSNSRSNTRGSRASSLATKSAPSSVTPSSTSSSSNKNNNKNNKNKNNNNNNNDNDNKKNNNSSISNGSDSNSGSSSSSGNSPESSDKNTTQFIIPILTAHSTAAHPDALKSIPRPSWIVGRNPEYPSLEPDFLSHFSYLMYGQGRLISSRMQAVLTDILDVRKEDADAKFIIFSQYPASLKEAMTALMGMNRTHLDMLNGVLFDCAIVDSKSTPTERANNLKRFTEVGSCNVCLLPIGAAAAGLTLTVSRVCYMLEPTHSAADEAQV